MIERALAPRLDELSDPPPCQLITSELFGPLLPVLWVNCGSQLDLPQPVPRPLLVPNNVQNAVQWLVWGTTEAERARGLFAGFAFLSAAERAGIEVGATQGSDGGVRLRFARNGDDWGPGPLAGTSSQLFSFVIRSTPPSFSSPE
ncbi:MAG: hypothetical protein ACRDWA_15340 [Acidimicrobiia bacterium]